MAIKTMLRQLISKWGIMSIEMQQAFEGDMGVVGEDGSINYIENEPLEPVAQQEPLGENVTEQEPEQVDINAI